MVWWPVSEGGEGSPFKGGTPRTLWDSSSACWSTTPVLNPRTRVIFHSGLSQVVLRGKVVGTSGLYKN